MAREECDKFEENPDRIKRKFWGKWNWKVYVDKDLVEQVKPEEGPGEIYEQPNGQRSSEVHGQLVEQGHSGPEQLIHATHFQMTIP